MRLFYVNINIEIVLWHLHVRIHAMFPKHLHTWYCDYKACNGTHWIIRCNHMAPEKRTYRKVWILLPAIDGEGKINRITIVSLNTIVFKVTCALRLDTAETRRTASAIIVAATSSVRNRRKATKVTLLPLLVTVVHKNHITYYTCRITAMKPCQKEVWMSATRWFLSCCLLTQITP